MKTALITGITGQDGSYLAELLLAKGYAVHGLIRRSSTINTSRIDHIYDNPKLHLHFGDMTDAISLRRVLELALPDEVYNLAAQSHVRVSIDVPSYTVQTIANGTLNLLETIRDMGLECRVYQAGSSEMFGNQPAPQSLETKFDPQSPYAAAKVFAHNMACYYRESSGMYIVNGILFNHESPRRGETFVTRKITMAAAKIAAGFQDRLLLGNILSSRDWGYAKEYMEGIWLMLQQDAPRDYIIATGETHTVKEVLEIAFRHNGLDWNKYVEHSGRYDRTLDVHELKGDMSQTANLLDWRPQTTFEQLITIMSRHDTAMTSRGA